MSIAYISSKRFLLHEMGEGHPEQPSRLTHTRDQLIASGLYDRLQHYEAQAATEAQILAAHDPVYFDKLKSTSPREGLAYLDRDTAMNQYSLDAAIHACGAVVQGVDLVLSGKHERAFCAVRPPGHHAEKAKAMGFCMINNIAVGTYHALNKYKLQRIAIIDFDVHHGNGTEDILGNEPRVLFCSSFQHPFYPYTRHAGETMSISNLPLPSGTDGNAYRQAVTEQWISRLHAFNPQLIMISAGFDAHTDDDIANMNLKEDDYRWITRQITDIADEHAGGRIVSTLEGGYNLNALVQSVQSHIEVLSNV
jgi:acetoin utilization deacetylase AcuC-like enzyme